MSRIASIHLLESGNLELENISSVQMKYSFEDRFFAVVTLWDNPEFQALLDRAIEADRGGVAFE